MDKIEASLRVRLEKLLHQQQWEWQQQRGHKRSGSQENGQQKQQQQRGREQHWQQRSHGVLSGHSIAFSGQELCVLLYDMAQVFGSGCGQVAWGGGGDMVVG